MSRKCGTCWGEKKYIQGYMGKSEGKKLRGKPGCRWEDEMYVKEIGWEGMNWSCLLQDSNKWRAVVNMVMNI